MPAVITHDEFGRQVYDSLYMMIGESRDEFQAFLLGNQGPDVLFFAALHPLMMRVSQLGSRMHREQPIEALAAFREAVNAIPTADDAVARCGAASGGATSDRIASSGTATSDASSTPSAPGAPDASTHDIARAYVQGLLCHYLLDSTLHPFIYAQQWALCDAGVEGLDRSSAHEVHAAIESELDELVLSVKRGQTIGDFDPSRKTLVANDHVLNVISALYERVAHQVFEEMLPPGAYRVSAKAYRLALRALWSPTGVKRALLGRIEEVARRYSYARAMSHRNHRIERSIFDNHDHEPWFDEDAAAQRTESFWDLYDRALAEAFIDVPEFAATSDTNAFLCRVTGGRNYNGQIAEPIIVHVE